jgi:translation elongation factor P/translation initiation factor 5A
MQTSHLPHGPAIIHFELDCVFTGSKQQHDFRSLESIHQKPQNAPEWISVNM